MRRPRDGKNASATLSHCRDGADVADEPGCRTTVERLLGLRSRLHMEAIMRSSTSPLAALLAAVLAAAPAILAAQSVLQPSDREGYYIAPVEMLDVYGVYPLSDGRLLRVTNERHRVWAELQGVGKFPLTPVASVAFVSPDRSYRFQFKPMAFATEVLITVRPG
jgi:hypothetical protein